MRPSWDLIHLLLAVHRSDNFEAAAQMLKMDPSTLRRKLHALERQVGRPIFTRSNGRPMMAPEHAALLVHAEQMEAAYQDVLAHCAASGAGGTLRVSTLDILADILVGGLPDFRRSHPDIRIELTTEPHFVDLERDRIDVAIRLARPLRGREGLRRLVGLKFAIYASPRYIAERKRAPKRPHEFLSLYTYQHRIDHDFMLADEQWHLDPELSGSVVARVDNYPNLLRMCEQGLGLAMLPCVLADESRRVERFPGARRVVEVDVWALIRHDVAKLPNTRAFVRFVSATFAAVGRDPAGRTRPI